jgi:hypothetical protein
MGELKSPPYNSAVSKKGFDLPRCRVGSDIKIFWFLLEQEIAHSAANQVGVKAIFTESVHDLEGVRINLASSKGMFIALVDYWF